MFALMTPNALAQQLQANGWSSWHITVDGNSITLSGTRAGQPANTAFDASSYAALIRFARIDLAATAAAVNSLSPDLVEIPT